MISEYIALKCCSVSLASLPTNSEVFYDCLILVLPVLESQHQRILHYKLHPSIHVRTPLRYIPHSRLKQGYTLRSFSIHEKQMSYRVPFYIRGFRFLFSLNCLIYHKLDVSLAAAFFCFRKTNEHVFNLKFQSLRLGNLLKQLHHISCSEKYSIPTNTVCRCKIVLP